jgi:cytosolic carboxypeptidase protein 2/3
MMKPQISVPRPIPLITASYSLKPDMMYGWKPDISNIHGAPIPLYFDYEDMEVPINPQTDEEYPVTYYGPRFRDTLEMHKAFANKTIQELLHGEIQTYKFKFPPNMNVIEACLPPKKKTEERPFVGMNPEIEQNEHKSINPTMFKNPSLIFDSLFECGNLDMVVQIRENEYDLYMRVDSNTRGHHQWFYFSV